MDPPSVIYASPATLGNRPAPQQSPPPMVSLAIPYLFSSISSMEVSSTFHLSIFDSRLLGSLILPGGPETIFGFPKSVVCSLHPILIRTCYCLSTSSTPITRKHGINKCVRPCHKGTLGKLTSKWRLCPRSHPHICHGAVLKKTSRLCILFALSILGVSANPQHAVVCVP